MEKLFLIFCINTPEYGRRLADEAMRYNERPAHSKKVRVISARKRTAAYKRMLAYMCVDNTSINTRLVTAGPAHVFILDPFDRSDDWLRL